MTKAAKKKHLQVRMSDVLSEHLSASRISLTILQGLDKKVDKATFDDVVSIVEDHVHGEADSYGLLIATKIYRAHNNGQYLVIPHEKNSKDEDRDVPLPRYRTPANTQGIEAIQNAKTVCILHELTIVLSDQDPDTLEKAIANAILEEEVILLQRILDHAVYL